MRVVVHLSGYYDWEPVPKNVEVTKQDLDSGRARPAAHGGHTMRVPKKGDTFNETCVLEDDIVGTILHAYTEHSRCGAILTRKEAIARLMGTLILPLFAHRKWIEDVEVSDDGPNEALFRKIVAPHLVADHGKAPGKNVEEEDLDELLAAYMEPCDEAAHVKHLIGHFKVKKKAEKHEKKVKP